MLKNIAMQARPRGLAAWSPQPATLALLAQVRDVLDEYRDYLPLTLRQIFYRLVGSRGYDKTERAYDRLGEHLNRARRAGLIAFDAIRDDGAEITTTVGWSSRESLVNTWRATVCHYRRDRQQGQPQRLLIIVEAAGMKPQIEAAAEDWSVPVIASGGFDSLTAKHELAQQLGDYDGLTEVLHIGDHDPSGVHLFASMAEDVEALLGDLGLDGSVEFTRLAVTPDQIATLGLPTAPPKATDRRAFEGHATVQAEAIAPNDMAAIVVDAITERLDFAAYRRVLAREAADKRELLARLGAVDDRDNDTDGDGEGNR